MSMRTLKIPIQFKNESEKEEIKAFIINFNNVLRFTYNRYQENPKLTTKEITMLQQGMNHVFIDSHFLNSARYAAKSMQDKQKVIFGGKKLFLDRCQGKISKEEFQLKRLAPLCSVGEACQKADRKFRILDHNHILFQPDRDHHYVLILPKLRKNYKRDILTLMKLQEQKVCPITYRLSLTHIELCFEDSYLGKEQYEKVKDRVFAVDLNPNYIGWTIVDWVDSDTYKLVDSGVVSNKNFTDYENRLKTAGNNSDKIKLNNKRSFENADTAICLINIAKHYRCQMFGIENLDITSSDKGKGKAYNRLVNNQWNRNKTYELFHKYCDRNDIKFISVKAQYSSFEGNLVYRYLGLPDMCLASVEIGRRAFEFYHQYMIEDKPIKKNIIFHESETAINRVRQSLEELSCDVSFRNLKDLYKKLKIRKLKYRIPLDGCTRAVLSKKSIKSNVLLYSF